MSKYSFNSIIGGEFGQNPWQRGTAFNSVASASYTADRFQYNKNGTMVHNISKDSNVPTAEISSSFQSMASMLIDCATAQATLGAADYCAINYKIEGYDLQVIRNYEFYLGFYVYSNRVGTYCVSIRNAGNNQTYLLEYEVTAPNVWEWKDLLISKSPTAGTWDYTSGIGLNIAWVLGAGSNFRDLTNTADTWLAANYLCTDNQENLCDSSLNRLWIDNVSIFRYGGGSALKDNTSSNYMETLKECQRYYEKSYNPSTAPGANTTVGICSTPAASGARTNIMSLEKRLIIPKRITPTMTWYAQDGTINNITDTVAGNVAVSSVANEGCASTGYPIIGVGSANPFVGHWVADAEL